MEVTKTRNIRSGIEYDHLFTKAPGETYTVKKNATLSDTVGLIPKVVQQTLDQTKLISQKLKGKTIYETCKKIWHFVYDHIQYKKDKTGYEQIRSPRRTWHDRKEGVDCDCYTVFISSILTNLSIPHTLRITKYKGDNFQHIYPIEISNGKQITIDCVTNLFNYEVPFRQKKDYPMELQFLDGLDDDGMDELGKIIQRNMAKKKKPLPLKANIPLKASKPLPVKKAMTVFSKKSNSKTVSPSRPAAPASPPSMHTTKRKKGILKKVVNAVNKVNPATVLLRNGILAAMKLNIKNVAARLRWSYLSPSQAAAKNIDPVKFQKLVATRQKLEKIFYGAGGKTDNLRKAILGGKGNKDKAVHGLGMLPLMQDEVIYFNEYMPLDQLLSPEIYLSENVEGMEGFGGFGELGEPVTLTTIGAAMGVIAGIVAALKQIGDIFKSKQKESADFNEDSTDAPENNVTAPSSNAASPTPATATPPTLPEAEMPPIAEENRAIKNTVTASSTNELVRSYEDVAPARIENEVAPYEDQGESNESIITNAPPTGNNTAPEEKQSFWDKNKKWITPVAIGIGGLTVIAIGYSMVKKDKAQSRSSPATASLGSLPKKRQKKKSKTGRSKNHHRKTKRAVKKEIMLL